jgi:hypothetical protein
VKADVDEYLRPVAEEVSGALADTAGGLYRAACDLGLRLAVIDDKQRRGAVPSVFADQPAVRDDTALAPSPASPTTS